MRLYLSDKPKSNDTGTNRLLVINERYICLVNINHMSTCIKVDIYFTLSRYGWCKTRSSHLSHTHSLSPYLLMLLKYRSTAIIS